MSILNTPVRAAREYIQGKTEYSAQHYKDISLQLTFLQRVLRETVELRRLTLEQWNAGNNIDLNNVRSI